MTTMFKSYRDLEVWQKGMSLAKDIYRATVSFPDDEKFGLVNQMRRSAVSVPSNIAEGHACSGTGAFQHFVSIAMGSVAEIETQVLLSIDLEYISADVGDDLLRKLDKIGRMLRGLQKVLMQRKRRSEG